MKKNIWFAFAAALTMNVAVFAQDSDGSEISTTEDTLLVSEEEIATTEDALLASEEEIATSEDALLA